MSFKRNQYLFGSAIAVTGGAASFVFMRHYLRDPSEKHRDFTKLSPQGTSETPKIKTSTLGRQPLPLNVDTFTKCQVTRVEYETPDTKRLSIRCPIDESFHQSEREASSDLIFTHFVAKEPEGTERKYFPIFHPKKPLKGSDKPSVNTKEVEFDLLVKRAKHCKNSMFLQAIYPEEFVDIKGPFHQHIQGFSENASKETIDNSLWGKFIGSLRQKYKLDEEPSFQRYFIASGADGISQVYSCIRQTLQRDDSLKAPVENFLLLSADSTVHLPMMDEIGGLIANQNDKLSSAQTGPSDKNHNFYQYITLNEPRWGWQGGYGSLDERLLKSLIGTRESNMRKGREVMLVVAGDGVFRNRIGKDIEKSLNYAPDSIRFIG